jgi:hypothetical protein
MPAQSWLGLDSGSGQVWSRRLPPASQAVLSDRPGDAERLTRLLHIGELPTVRVPTHVEEAARDLVRARASVIHGRALRVSLTTSGWLAPL